MMVGRPTWVAAAISLLTCVVAESAAAADGESSFSCPASIEVKQDAAQAPAGWESLSLSPLKKHGLRSIGFFRGHPSGKAELKPARIEKFGSDRRARLDTYLFVGPAEAGFFAVCRYRSTNTVLLRRLSSAPKSCTVTYPGTSTSNAGITLECD